MAPWLFAIGVAFLLEGLLAVRSSASSTIEGSVVAFSRSWAPHAGVLRVYSEPDLASGQRMIIECVVAPDGVPGESDGFPVRIRVVSGPTHAGPAESAARDFVAALFREGTSIPIATTSGGRTDTISFDEYDSAIVSVVGHSLPRVDSFAKQAADPLGVTLQTRIVDGRTDFRFSVP